MPFRDPIHARFSSVQAARPVPLLLYPPISLAQKYILTHRIDPYMKHP